MLLLGVALAFLVIFLTFHAFVIPHLERMCRADVETSLVRRAARLQVAYLARAMSATAMIVTGLVVLLLLVLVLLPQEAATSAALIRRVAELRLHLTTVPPLVFAAVAVVTTTLLVLAVRATTRRRVAQISERALSEALENLARERAAGVWIELSPTPDMLAVDQAIQEALYLLGRVETSSMPTVERDARIAEIQTRHNELLAARERLDVKRRLTDEVDLGRLVAPVLGGPIGLVAPPWFRQGPLQTITAARRWSFTAVLLLAYTGTAGALVPALSSALDERLIAIDEKAIRIAENRALARALPADERAPSAPLSEREAQAFHASVARAFEMAFGAFLIQHTDAYGTRSLVREGLILDFVAARRREGTVRAVATLEEATSGPERAAVDWVMARAREGEPITVLGRRFAEEGRELARRYPAVLERVRSNPENQLREVDERPPITALKVVLASEAVGEVLSSKAEPDSPVRPATDALRSEIGAELLEPVYVLKSRQFNAVMAETTSIESAAAWTARMPLERMRKEEYRPLMPTLARLPGVDPSHPPASLAPPAVREEPSPDVDAFRAQGVLLGLREQLGYRADGAAAWRLTAPVAEYDDWVPAQTGSETRTLRGKLLAEWSAAALDPGLFARSRSASSLSAAARGAGLVIGMPPLMARVEPDLRDLRWRTHLQLLQLIAVDGQDQLVELGTFPRSTIAAALAYAADARPVALAVSSGAPLPGRRAILHPALVDSPLGCRVHALVERLEAFARSTTADEEAEHFIQLTAAYQLAWALRARHVDQVAWLEGRPEHPEWVRSEAEMRLLDPEIAAAVGRAVAAQGSLARSDKSVFRKMPNYFDPWLVEVIEECAASPDRTELDTCISGSVRRWVEGRATGAALPWWHLPPESDLSLYASDAPFSLDAELKALRMPPEGDFTALMAMLDIGVAMTFTTPAHPPKPTGKKARVDEDAAFGRATWPLPDLGERTTRALLRTIADSPQRRQLVEAVVQFVVLQRFFRLALDGKLGPRFPLERLTSLSRLVGRSPMESVRTSRWYDRSGSVERGLAGKLEAAQAALDRAAHTSARPGWVSDARRAFSSCASDIGERDAARENLAEISDEAWSRACLFPEPPALGKGPWAPSEAIVRAVAREARAVRELRRLRRAVGVHKDDQRSGDACPAL